MAEQTRQAGQLTDRCERRDEISKIARPAPIPSHVAAHVATEGNELADRMAMLGAQRKEKGLRLYRKDMDIPALLKLRAE